MSKRSLNAIEGESGKFPDPLPEMKADTKPASLDSPYGFKHTPPEPDGDPWEILLKPELEADTERCDAWKDEVQNLLIFAGLFSAVVTAFVIESYKFLQQDPNDAVIGLLFLIANNLNNTAALPPSVDPASIATPFSQTPSSVRINVFWFISLILSLTTVLIGTISLQWLREHQSYSGFSTKEKLAILHMRQEALEVWHVPQIFAALPALLQCALVLFLAGLVDFVLPLGRSLTIPVTIIIGLTLLFLVATTALPTFQGSLFLTSVYPHRRPPTPCAFKSPQSRIFLALLAPAIRGVSWVLFRFYNHLDSRGSEYARVLRRSTAKPWPHLDWGWLRLRDACHQCILDKDPALYDHQTEWRDSFPLSDITQRLVETVEETPTAKHTGEFLVAVIHCFHKLSASIGSGSDKDEYSPESRDRRSNYFAHLHQQPSGSVAKYLQRHQSSYELFQYNLELWTQIMSIASSTPQSSGSSPELGVLDQHLFYADVSEDRLDRRYAVTVALLNVIFRAAASHRISWDCSLDSLCAHIDMARVLGRLASLIDDYLEWTQENTVDTFNRQYQQDRVSGRFGSICKFIADRLNEEVSSDLNPVEDTPSVLFYLASIFMWELLVWLDDRETFLDAGSSFGQGLRSFLEALLQYRTCAQTSEWKNVALETRFKKEDYSFQTGSRIDRFSDEWWDTLFETGHRLESKDAEKGTASTEGSSPDSRPKPLSQEAAASRTTKGIFIAMPSPFISPAVVNHSPASNATTTDGDHNNVLQTNPQSPLSTYAVPNSDDQDDETKRRLMSNSPLSVNLTDETKNGTPGPAHTPTLPYSQLSSTDPHLTSAPDGKHAAAEDGLQASVSPQPPPSSGVAQQRTGVSSTGDGQAQIQPDGPHLTIDVGSPIRTPK